MASNGLEIAIEQVHPGVCSASLCMHFIYLYINQILMQNMSEKTIISASWRMHLRQNLEFATQI